MKQNCQNRVSHLTIDFLYDVMVGIHDEPLKTALKGTALKDLRCLEVNSMDQCREIFRMLTAHKTVVQVDASGPPAVSARTLQRW